MKRSWFSIAAVLSLIVVVSIASAQQQYSGSQPSGTSSTQSSDASTQSQTTDPATTTPTTTTENSTTSDASTLPSTASPMPLVGVIGLMTLAAGLWVARMRQKKV